MNWNEFESLPRISWWRPVGRKTRPTTNTIEGRMRSSYSKEGRRSEERGADRTSCPPLRQDFASNKIRPAFTNEKLFKGRWSRKARRWLAPENRTGPAPWSTSSATNSRVSSWNDLKSLLGHLSRIELFKVQSQFTRNSRQNFIFKFGLQSSKDYLFFHQSLFAYQEYYLHINSHTWKYVRLLWTPCPFSDCTQRS
jgi:hypothetical protein